MMFVGFVAHDEYANYLTVKFVKIFYLGKSYEPALQYLCKDY